MRGLLLGIDRALIIYGRRGNDPQKGTDGNTGGRALFVTRRIPKFLNRLFEFCAQSLWARVHVSDMRNYMAVCC